MSALPTSAYANSRYIQIQATSPFKLHTKNAAPSPRSFYLTLSETPQLFPRANNGMARCVAGKLWMVKSVQLWSSLVDISYIL
jgi:hypothetical protein